MLLKNKIKVILDDIREADHQYELMESKISLQENHIKDMKENKDKIKVCKMDVDSNRELAAKYGIRSIPSLIIFKDGEPAGVEIGALSKQQLEEFISTVV